MESTHGGRGGSGGNSGSGGARPIVGRAETRAVLILSGICQAKTFPCCGFFQDGKQRCDVTKPPPRLHPISIIKGAPELDDGRLRLLAYG